MTNASPASDPAVRVDLLRQEYFLLQEMIEKFDARALQIKGWSVTVSLAGMAAALISNAGAEAKLLAFLLAAVAALAFWMIEFAWKCFQWSFLPRVHAIETAFRDGTAASIAPLQIRSSFGATIGTVVRAHWRRAFRPFIALPHLVTAAIGLALAAGMGRPA